MSETQSAGRFSEIGVAGLKINSGITWEEWLPDLRGPRGMKTYAEMRDNDDTVGAVLTAIKLLCRRVEWRVEADEKEDPDAEERAEFLQSCMTDMSHSWEDFISQALTMLEFGWSFAEIVLKRRLGMDQRDPTKRSRFTDGLIGIRKLAPRAQETLERWEMQDDGGIAGWHQRPPTPQSGLGLIFIPIERGLLFRCDTNKNNPEGRSILRNAYRAWWLKKNIENVEGIGIERELAGLPVVRIPAEYLDRSADPAKQAIRAQYEQIAKQLKFNEQGGLVLPSNTYVDSEGKLSTVPLVSVELISAGGARAIDTDKVVRRYAQGIARTALADFIQLGQDGKGSFALSKDKTDLFLNACQTYMDAIAGVLNAHLVPRLWGYNGWANQSLACFRPGRVQPEDLAALGDYLQKLASAGATLFPDEEMERHLRAVAGLPAPAEEDLAAVREQHDAQMEEEQAARDRTQEAHDAAMAGAGQQQGQGAEA